ncbi:MAG: hypothetical protein ACO2OS_06610 [Thermosphaera aggregans]
MDTLCRSRRDIEVSPEDAIKGVLEVVRNDGIFIGWSSGAVYWAF